jgi:hypothetical protein
VSYLRALTHLSFNSVTEVVLAITCDVGHSGATHAECVGLLVWPFTGA